MPTVSTVLRATLVAIAAAATALPAAHAADVRSNDKFPFTLNLFVDCANGGAGEVVALAGELHQQTLVNVSSSGQVVIRTKFQPMNVSGIGAATGDIYRGTGATQETTHFGMPGVYPYILTYVDNFRVIGQGTDNNFTVHRLIHETIDANGMVSVSFDRNSADCK